MRCGYAVYSVSNRERRTCTTDATDERPSRSCSSEETGVAHAHAEQPGRGQRDRPALCLTRMLAALRRRRATESARAAVPRERQGFLHRARTRRHRRGVHPRRGRAADRIEEGAAPHVAHHRRRGAGRCVRLRLWAGDPLRFHARVERARRSGFPEMRMGLPPAAIMAYLGQYALPKLGFPAGSVRRPLHAAAGAGGRTDHAGLRSRGARSRERRRARRAHPRAGADGARHCKAFFQSRAGARSIRTSAWRPKRWPSAACA